MLTSKSKSSAFGEESSAVKAEWIRIFHLNLPICLSSIDYKSAAGLTCKMRYSAKKWQLGKHLKNKDKEGACTAKQMPEKKISNIFIVSIAGSALYL